MKKADRLAILAITDDPLDIYSISNEFELLDSIDAIERCIRSSIEYRGWTFWQKIHNKQSTCIALNIDAFDYDNITLEMHHYPFSLFDVCWTIGLKMLSELSEDAIYTTFDIASKVITEHFKDIIGLVPMTKTYHQMYHEGLYTIDSSKIHGDYKLFIEKYKNFIPEIVLDRYNEKIGVI